MKMLTDEQLRMLELAQQGFHCSEVLLFMGLDALGQENPNLIRAVSALAGGIGFSGEVCGALTGGACLLGLYTGRGRPDEDEHPMMKVMIQDLVEWFSEKYGGRYGGIQCREITGDDPANVPSRCPRLITAVHKKVKSLLEQHRCHSQFATQSETSARDAKRACPFADRLA
jgi:C_GCAxxG_C_C family probable redox protein